MPAVLCPPFLKQGNAICAKGTRKIDHLGLTAFKSPEHPTPAEIVAFAKNVAVPVTQSELHQLRALKPPKGDESTVKTLIDKAQTAIDRVRANPSLLGGTNGSDEPNAQASSPGTQPPHTCAELGEPRVCGALL